MSRCAYDSTDFEQVYWGLDLPQSVMSDVRVGLDDLTPTSVGASKTKTVDLLFLYTCLGVEVLRLCSFTGARLWKRSASSLGSGYGNQFPKSGDVPVWHGPVSLATRRSH